jgi:hypothetical protein
MKCITSNIIYCDQSGPGEVEFEVTGELSPDDPGRFYGALEDCYPPEPSELLSWTVTWNGVETQAASDFEERIGTDSDLYDEIEQLLIEEAPTD